MSAEVPKNGERLEWFPFHLLQFSFSPTYRKLEDFQQAWFLNLLFACWTSERPGYLKDEGNLWDVAHAQNQHFFQKHSEPVLKLFQWEATLGGKWMYHPKLLGIYQEQLKRIRKARTA